MEDALKKAAWLLLLLPGFLTLGVARLLGSVPLASEFTLTILSLYFSILVAPPALLMTHLWLCLRSRTGALPNVLASAPYLFAATLISLPAGTLVAIAYEHGTLNRFVRVFVSRHTLTKVSDLHILEELLPAASLSEFRVRGNDGRDAVRFPYVRTALRVYVKSQPLPVYGHIYSWSVSAPPAQLYLTPACLAFLDGTLLALEGPGVWIPLAEVVRIDFMDTQHIHCLNNQFDREGPVAPSTQPPAAMRTRPSWSGVTLQNW